MNNEYQLIRNVSPGTNGWTVKVVVAEKSPPKTALKSPTKYQNFVLMDSEGTKVQATLYDQNITAFQEKLILGKTYLISNAFVKLTNAEYREKSGDVQWTISGRTRVEQIEEDNYSLLMSTYNFTSFNDLPEYMDSNADISIIAVVIDISPRRLLQTRTGTECQVQDLVLINKEFDTVLLTMWEAFVDVECHYISENLSKKPVLMGKNLKVSSFHGLSLSTKANSSFFIDGSFEVVQDLKSWARTNTAILEDIVSDKQYLTSACIKLSIPGDETKFTEIKNIRGLKNTRRFHWIKARSYVKVLNQSFWYMSCSNCNKISSEKFGDVYDCIYCKCTDVKAIPRAKVFLQLEDSTGNINASAIGNPAEYFLDSNAQALMEGTNSVRLEINDEKIFYVKTISKPHSSDFKLEVIFMFDPSNTSQENKEENDKGNTTTSNASNTPPAKRALFRCDDTTSTSNKKIASPENEDQGKIKYQ